MIPILQCRDVTVYSPKVSCFVEIDHALANKKLKEWDHRMGPLKRGNQAAICHGLFFGCELVAVTTVSTLISPTAAAGAYTRENTCELSRLCAARSGLCRVALRLWRETVFPDLPYEFAISYQDADLHNGNTYRFDGWKRVAFSHSGTDRRTKRPGRDKWIWVWARRTML